MDAKQIFDVLGMPWNQKTRMVLHQIVVPKETAWAPKIGPWAAPSQNPDPERRCPWGDQSLASIVQLCWRAWPKNYPCICDICWNILNINQATLEIFGLLREAHVSTYYIYKSNDILNKYPHDADFQILAVQYWDKILNPVTRVCRPLNSSTHAKSLPGPLALTSLR